MLRPQSPASRLLLLTAAHAGCVAMLLSLSGCRSASQQSFAGAGRSRTASYVSGANVSRPTGSEAAGPAGLSENPEFPQTVPAAPLTEEEVIAVFRQSGGKLRPNDSGAIVEVDLSFSQITDSQLAEIAVFPEVAELDLTGTEIHDVSIGSLQSLRKLRAAKLKGTRITNEGLRQLSQISSLILVDVSNTAISDDGLVDAAQWTNLRYLSMNNTEISDAGLEHLGSLRELKGLSVIGTAVTETGVLALKTQLPDCLIVAQSEQKLSRDESQDSIPRLPPLEPSGSLAGNTSSRQLTQVIQLAGQQPHLALHLSRIYSTSEQWQEAAEILATASVVNPDDAAIHAALGEALARSGRPDEALAHFQQFADEADAKYLVGIIVYENNLKTSERYFDEVLRSNPGLSDAYVRRARIQQELATLKHLRNAPVNTGSREAAPEIIPAPSVKTVSRSRQLPSH